MEWLEAAETEALCFPRHINVMVLATIDEALKMGRGPFHLDKDALERVKEATKNGRNDYYRSRLGGFESREIQAAKDVVQSIRSGDGDAIESARRGLERAMGKEADGNEAKALVREMTRKGMLRIDGQGGYTEGIPSFCDWLLTPPETTQRKTAPDTTRTFLWKVRFRNDDGTKHEYMIESTSAPGAIEKLLVTGFADDIGREPRENDEIYVDDAKYVLKYEDGKLSPRAATPP